MRRNHASLLIATMFGSFSIVLAVMIVLFHPGPKTSARKSVEAEKRSAHPVDPGRKDSVISSSASPVQISTDSVLVPAKAPPKVKTVPPPPRPAPVAGRRLLRALQQELRALDLHKAEAQRDLNKEVASQEKILSQYVTVCKEREPGEAAALLLELNDDQLAEVLGQLNREKAVKIAAFLRILGREEPVPFR